MQHPPRPMYCLLYFVTCHSPEIKYIYTKKSGQAVIKLTDQEKYIVAKGSFLSRHCLCYCAVPSMRIACFCRWFQRPKVEESMLLLVLDPGWGGSWWLAWSTWILAFDTFIKHARRYPHGMGLHFSAPPSTGHTVQNSFFS